MFTATFYFLGLAGFLVAASACLSCGRRAGQQIQVDLTDLRAASVNLLMAGKKPSWDELRGLWMQWYARCQQKAILKQKATYSWARTLSLCAALCIVGVLLEVELDDHISISRIFAGLQRSCPTATDVPMSCSGAASGQQ
jgi:hypothetical protein